ncbi:MFS transporter [Nocardioides zeae]|uniref:EmrB/QacA subfamily drug resistance transporter n=1 Tax=Nocardioides zeae TaxID=1457234 RepID=A0AAJ1X392_9ACTN|nr:MFS transporter [Nocardioides zeae]MDQ1104332.1 EmrB/QacA subfamily drug resistance transporter [Nocardioides zeae]
MTEPLAPAQPAQPVQPLHHPDPRRWAVLATCCLALFLVGLDTTAVNVALPAIGADLGIAPAALPWVVDAYTLVLASLLISSGALADRFGRRRLLRAGLVLFAAASALCALAPTPGLLVAARAVQGVGASMLSPVGLAIVVGVFPDARERARAVGAWAGVFGASMAVGPLLGGALVDLAGWRWVFGIVVPVAVLALGLTVRVVPESRVDHPRRLDLPGQVLLTAVVGGAVALLIEAPHRGATSPAVLMGAGALLIAVVLLVGVELRRTDPLLDPRLLRVPAFAGAVVAAIAVFVALNAALLATSLHLQDGRGASPTAVGAVTLPLALAATLVAPVSGVLVGRCGPRGPLAAAGGLLALAGALLRFGPDDITPGRLAIGLLVLGIGFGLANAPITTTAVSSLPPERAGVAGGITSAARQLGAALGIAAAGAVLARAAVGSEATTADVVPGIWALVLTCGAIVAGLASVLPRSRDRGA